VRDRWTDGRQTDDRWREDRRTDNRQTKEPTETDGWTDGDKEHEMKELKS